MEGGSRRLTDTERLAVETGRPVFSKTEIKVLEGDVQPGESAIQAAIRSGRSVMLKTTTTTHLAGGADKQ